MSAEPARRGDIAIVGMACRVPGARDVDEFWKLVAEGREGIRTLEPSELEQAGVPAAQHEDPAYVRRAGTLDGPYCFDQAFFGMSPREAELTDPQQRILLECAWHALEHAGIAPAGARVGVYAGIAHNYYYNRVIAADEELRLGDNGFMTLLGADKDYAAARIAFKLDLRGPALTVQTACSTSGVALHLACQALRAGDCDVALAGSARVNVPDTAGYQYIEGGPQSADGRVRPFGAEASGMVLTPGVACLVLKPLARALADGERVYAVVKGTALNNDGADKIAFTAPSQAGQLEVLLAALAAAGVPPESVGLIEAHGTGTALGDPIEVAALAQAYGKAQRIALGSVKANIGHLDTAAGFAGLIKAALALHHRKLPPAIHCDPPNPECEFERTPFVLEPQLRDWPGTSPRRAAVSSFGFGGTNFHGILEEAPAQTSGPAQRPYQLLRLSARSEAALAAQAQQLAAFLSSRPGLELADVANTLDTGRARLPRRSCFVARNAAQAAALLAQPLTTGGPGRAAPSLVFMFPGQGAQHVDMGRELYECEPVFRAALDRCAEVLAPILGSDIRRQLYPPAAERERAAQALRATGLAQPAIFAISYATALLWQCWGLKPAALVGHSVGEYVAATLAGVFELEDALAIIGERARLMQSMPAGSMLAVRLQEEQVQELLRDGIALAGVNSPGLVVLSGPGERIAELDAGLRDRGIGSTLLHTSHAFHSAMMEPIVQRFAEVVARHPRKAPRVPLVSTLSAQPVGGEMQEPDYWARQLRHTVRFGPAIAHLLQAPGRVFLEVGPGNNLSTSVRQALRPEHQASAVASLPHAGQADARALEHLIGAAGKLWIAGIELAPAVLNAGESRLKVGLPGYPFARVQHFLKPAARPSSLPAWAPAAVTPQSEPASQPAAHGEVHARVLAVLTRLTGREFSEAQFERSFLDLGLDSLVLTQAAAKLKSEFHVELRFRDLFDRYDSIARLAAYLQAQQAPAQILAPHAPAAVAPGAPPRPGARLGRDAAGRPGWFVADAEHPGQYVQVEP
ncbi:MAG TPA: beta-ketoacyl synthase N-terminal-like domain-containing protein [Candidatus Binatia bacterium]|nr:beta-ketoacyl synthase N-terminal-like domain-containing protein [Candidatus Binatia bacterium]